MSSNTDDVTLLAGRLIGRVKWFNNKAGYGFLTVTDGVRSGSDMFVHHSSINVENQQYKYLVQGEYVEFQLNKTTSGPHEWQAVQVSGINNGKLMCETRREFKLARTNYKSDKDEFVVPELNSNSNVKQVNDMPVQSKIPRETSSSLKPRAPRVRGEGPREGNSKENKEWKLVGKKSDAKVSNRTTRP